MERVIKMLDRAKVLCVAQTDTEFAKCLRVTKSALSNWRSGKAFPDEVSCARLAEILEEPVARILGIVGEARSHSSAAKAVWRRLAAEAGCLALFLAASMPAKVEASVLAVDQVRIMYISRLKKALSRYLDGLNVLRYQAV